MARNLREGVILYLGSNPLDSEGNIDLEGEYCKIRDFLTNSASSLTVAYEPRVSPAQVPQFIDRHRPRIVHFGCHGDFNGRLQLTAEDGYSQGVEPEAVACVFGRRHQKIKCVVINACYSESQAMLIARHVDFVIGMRTKIDDETAKAFSLAFYTNLHGHGDVGRAFDDAREALRMQGLAEHVPRIHRRDDVPSSFDRDRNAAECRERASRRIIDVLRRMDGLATCLRTQWDKEDVESLTAAILSECDPLAFSEKIYDSVAIVEDDALPAKIATGIVEVFDHALPAVICNVIRYEPHDGDLQSMNADHAYVLESMMAALDRRQVDRMEDGPRHYLPVNNDDDDAPCAGMTYEQRKKVVLDGWFRSDKRAGTRHRRSRPQDQFAALQQNLKTTARRRTRYTIARNTDLEGELDFLRQLKRDLPQLAIVIPDLTDLDYDRQVRLLEVQELIYDLARKICTPRNP